MDSERQVFILDDSAWDEFQALLRRPPLRKPSLTSLLTDRSILEQ